VQISLRTKIWSLAKSRSIAYRFFAHFSDGFSKLFQQSPDFMIQYCSIAMNSILSNSNVRDSDTKFCPGKMSKLFATLADVPNNDSVGLMNTLVKWNREEGQLTWLYLTSSITNSKTGKG
jgi:hypothetical protein